MQLLIKIVSAFSHAFVRAAIQTFGFQEQVELPPGLGRQFGVLIGLELGELLTKSVLFVFSSYLTAQHGDPGTGGS